VPSWLRELEQVYCRLDRRVLGVFRAALGMVLLYDLLRRFPDAGLLWSNDGVLTNVALRKAPQAAHQLSFLLSVSSASAVRLAFGGLGVLFLLYTLGLFTRWVQPLVLLGYASLNARNLFFEDGGTGLVIILLTWTVALPLADRFALDALRRDAALATLKARVVARAEARKPLLTLAGLAILLQAAVIYGLNAAHKTGATWRGGDAVHLVLWQHRVNTPFALWLSRHEPSWFSPPWTWLTKRTEVLLPLLLLWPSHPKQTRSAAFALALLLHGGIALTLTLGPFSYAMICLLWLTVPGEVLDIASALGRRSARLGFWRFLRVRARAVRGLRELGLAARAPLFAAAFRGRLVKLREALLVWMLFVEGVSVLSSNRAVPKRLRVTTPGPLVEGYKPYLRGIQSWSMFAPDAPKEDGTMVVDAVTVGGQHIDPFTGQPPNWQQIRDGLAPHSIALSDYFFSIHDDPQARYRHDLARYLREFPTATPSERLRSAEVWWVSYVPPERGSYEPGPIKKQRLWKLKL
jgi:hypothetical protein